jgi:hypothetical protein
MDDYPRTLMELESRFATDAACRRLPREGSMAAGPLLLGVCPYEDWSTGRGLLAPTLATAGAIFQDTRTPLTLWFRAIW